MRKISALEIKSIHESGRYRAGECLYLQVTPAKSGGGVNKSWLLRYQINGKARQMGLGSLSLFSLAEARARAKKFRQGIADGIDPIETKRAERAARKAVAAKQITFGKCAQDYIAAHAHSWKNKKHVAQWKAAFEGKSAATTEINDLPVAAIDTALVLKVLRPLWEKTPESASRIRGRIERVLAWATVSEYRSGDNPARWRGHLKEMLPAKSKIRKVKHHKAMPYAELPAFMAATPSSSATSSQVIASSIPRSTPSDSVSTLNPPLK
jgi:hypothetical protein